MPEKQTLLPDATWTPNVPHWLTPARTAEALRGELGISLSSSCLELPQLLQTHLSWKLLATLGSLQASNEEDRCWGVWRGAFGHHWTEDLFQPPLPSGPFPSLLESSFVWGCWFVASQELKSMNGKKAQLRNFIPNQKSSPQPSASEGLRGKMGWELFVSLGVRTCPLLETASNSLVDQTIHSRSFLAPGARFFPEQPSKWSCCRTETVDELQPSSMLPAWKDPDKPTSHTKDFLRSRLSPHARKEWHD